MNKAILVQGGDGTAIPAGMVGEVKESIGSNNVNKAGGLGVDVVFDSAGAPTVTLGVGIWVIHGYTALTSTAAADTKSLRLYDNTAGVAFGGGTPCSFSDLSVQFPCSCSGFINVTSGTKVIYLYGMRNGGSGVTIGINAANTSCGYMIAIRIA